MFYSGTLGQQSYEGNFLQKFTQNFITIQRIQLPKHSCLMLGQTQPLTHLDFQGTCVALADTGYPRSKAADQTA